MSQQINLYNPIFLKQRKIFSAVTMAQALGVILAGTLAFAAFAHYQVRQLAAEVQRGDARVKAEEARLTRLTTEFAARAKSADLEAELHRAETELKLLRDVLDLLAGNALGARDGVSPYMRALARQHLEGLWLTGFQIAGQDMTLSGRALRGELLPEYLRRLGREQAMQGRQFAMLNLQQPKVEEGAKEVALPYLEFSLRSTPTGDTKEAGR